MKITPRCRSIHGPAPLKMKAVRSFETSGCNYPTTQHNNPEEPLRQYENRLATNKIFHRCNFASGWCGNGQAIPNVLNISIFFAVFFLIIACYTNKEAYGPFIATLLVEYGGILVKLTLLRTNIPFPVFLSVTRAHTYTHTHTCRHTHVDIYT